MRPLTLAILHTFSLSLETIPARVMHDRKLSAVEAELLLAIASILGCPMHQIIPQTAFMLGQHRTVLFLRVSPLIE